MPWQQYQSRQDLETYHLRLAAEPTIYVAEAGPGRDRRVGGEAPPYVEIPYFQPSISRKGPTTSPSTKLVLKYIELR